jgi:coproporphyrinogen III oxidase
MLSRRMEPPVERVASYLRELQERICAALESEDGGARFEEERIPGERGALARPRWLAGGSLVEKAAVHFTHSVGPSLPPTATERRPELAGRAFAAASLSLIVHPQNPFVPTTHMNLRFFQAEAAAAGAAPVWWFGGGFDLTPCYGFDDDCVHWHRTARDACAPLGADAHPRLKQACDAYFFLPHRGEPRGIGGIFFDDLDAPDFETCFAFLRSVGDHFLPAYLPIVRRRRDTPFGARERDFQLVRRGRYAEFNLVIDRGTRYGLQSGRRVESVLASLPPLVAWRIHCRPEPGSREAELTEKYLVARDWLAGA